MDYINQMYAHIFMTLMFIAPWLHDKNMPQFTNQNLNKKIHDIPV